MLRLNVPAAAHFDQLLDDETMINNIITNGVKPNEDDGTINCKLLVEKCWEVLLANSGGVITQTDTEWNRYGATGSGGFNSNSNNCWRIYFFWFCLFQIIAEYIVTRRALAQAQLVLVLDFDFRLHFSYK